MIRELKIAEQIAREVHRKQKRSDGKDYITHPKAVADSLGDIECKIVAWLHDVIEDTDISLKDLLEKGIPQNLVDVINCLSRRTGENYKDYILQISKNKIATKVKIADLRHNLSNLKNGSMKDKYLLALHILIGSSK